MTLALPGDTVLYLLLPLQAAAFAVTLPEAGFLLAANRIVRVFGYRWVAAFYSTRGVWLLLVACLIWGLAFAAMNIANQALPTSHHRDALQRMGRARSIVAVGPMAGLLLGHHVRAVGAATGFMAPTVIALTALMSAAQLPKAPKPVHQQRPRFAAPDAFSIWSFCMGFALDGLVFGLSLLAVVGLGRSGVIAASLAMALRYVSEILLSPAGGRLARRCGARRMLVALSLGAASTLACWEHPSHFYGSACCRP